MSDAAAAAAPASPLSARTRVLGAASLAFIALLVVLALLGIVDETGAYAGAIGYGAFASVFAIIQARRLGAGPQRTQWVLIGASISAFIAGDIATVANEELGQGAMLAAAQLFYLLQFVTLSWAMMTASLAYRAMLDLRRSAAIAFGTAAALAAAATALGALGGFGAGKLVGIDKFLAIYFPIADLLFMFGPALFVLLVSRQMGAARFAWPWIAVAVGSAVFAQTDVMYYYLQGWQGELNVGFMVVGAGRLLAALLFAIGSSLARDVFAL